MAAIINQGNWSYFVQKDLSMQFAVDYGEQTSMIPTLFTVKKPDQAIHYEALEGGLGQMPVFVGEVEYDDAKQSYRKSTQEIEYAYGIKVTKRFRRADLYGVVQRKVRELASVVWNRRESIAAGILNGAFSTTTVADTCALCYASHPSDQTGGVTQGNAGSLSFSAANVEATRQLMIAFKTNRGSIRTRFPNLIIVPTALEEKAYELIKSKGKVDTAMNNPNFHEGKYRLAVWHNFLTSAKNWFFVNEKEMKEYLYFLEWNPVEFFYAGEMDTLTSKHAAYMSNNVTTADWRWLYGQQGS